MEIIEFTTGNPEWFWPVATPVIALIIVVSIYVALKSRINEVALTWIGLGCLGLFVGWLVFGAITSDNISLEEKERVASEVSEVVGFEVSEGEVDLMLDEKPVRGVYYIRDDNTLVVEKEGA